MANIYMGRGSCYALRECVYVARRRGKGIDSVAEAAGIAMLILRDYRRGRTYDHSCRRIRMSWRLAEARLEFLRKLARLHGAEEEVVERIDELVDYVLARRRLPRWALPLARRALARARGCRGGGRRRQGRRP